jgi:hypothetical protein
LKTKVGSYSFDLAGREGRIRLGKLADPRPQLPRERLRVRVGLDKSGSARVVAVVALATVSGEQPTAAAQLSIAVAGRYPAAPTGSDTVSVRLAVLAEAAAARLEGWVTR